MAYEQRDLSGSLFRNDKKEAETHADYRGSAKVSDVEYFLDAWINTAKDGSKYMSLKFKPKEVRQERPQVEGFAGDLDDEVPF